MQLKVERLDPKPLNVRATELKRVEVNSLHLSVGSFWQSKRSSNALSRLRIADGSGAGGSAPHFARKRVGVYPMPMVDLRNEGVTPRV